MVERTLSSWQGMRTRDPRRLTLGSARWSMPSTLARRTGPPGADLLAELLALAREAGIRTLETARADGESEARIGRALAEHADWRVITKLAPDVDAPGLDLAASLERVRQSLARSREALAVDSIPVLLLPRYAIRHAFGGRLWRVLRAEREAGRIRQLGVAAANPEEAWAALGDPDVECLQVASSLLDLQLHRQGFFPRARESGRTIYVRGAFLEGIALLGSRRLPSFLAELAGAMQTIERFAEGLGIPPRILYLAFVRELPAVHPVLDCATAAQLSRLLRDWEDERVDGALLTALVDRLPTAPLELVDPSRWPRQGRIGPERAPSGPPSRAVADGRG